MNKRASAARFRALAREYERTGRISIPSYGWTKFTCSAVWLRHSQAMSNAYEAMFFPNNSDDALSMWQSPDKADIRVLALCFAAAMVETGDLP